MDQGTVLCQSLAIFNPAEKLLVCSVPTCITVSQNTTGFGNNEHIKGHKISFSVGGNDLQNR